MSGKDFSSVLNKAYDEAIHWVIYSVFLWARQATNLYRNYLDYFNLMLIALHWKGLLLRLQC